MTTATIAVHGGAGARRDEHRLDGIRTALAAGMQVLERGGSALDATCAAVVVLEDDGRFNAGRGAVPTSTGGIELDAAVMDGATRQAGAVAALTRARNPVLVARAVARRHAEVFLVGEGADQFAEETGCERAPADWFLRQAADDAPGTVGAVALDQRGNLAAATSTGGRTGQRPGRVGDTPVIGAGTFADARCAISATGDGEDFIRAVFAHRVAVLVEQGRSLADACRAALRAVEELGGSGGCIAITSDGSVELQHTTQAMPCGWVSLGGDLHVRQ